MTSIVPGPLRDLVYRFRDKVYMVPPVPHSELSAWIKDADIGLLPYENDDPNVAFCAPQKLFDYLACGVPFIGSGRPLIIDVAKRFNAGVVLNMLSHEEVAMSVNTLLDDTVALKKLSKNARHAYETEYNYDRLIAPFLDYVDTLTKSV